jgi:hypothetical protein
MCNPVRPSQDTSPFCSEVEFAKYEEDTGLLGRLQVWCSEFDRTAIWLTPVAIFTLAAAVMISAMLAAVVHYLVFAIMFSAPAVVGVVAFFAQSVDTSDCCNFDWAPVVQTSSHFVVRGGEIPFEVVQPSPMFHLVLLVMVLAGLAVMYRLVADFVRAAAVPYRALKTPEGQTYYFNVRTNETAWAVPVGGAIVPEDTRAMVTPTPAAACSSASTSLTSKMLAIGTGSPLA